MYNNYNLLANLKILGDKGMKKICKQCGTEFELSDSEIEFYKSKNLSLPKRCKQCRKRNKQRISPQKSNYNNSNLYNNRNTVNTNRCSDNLQYHHNNNTYKKKKIVISTALICALFVIVFGVTQLIVNNYEKILNEYISDVLPTSQSENINPTTEITTENTTEKQSKDENTIVEYQTDKRYTFRSDAMLQEHYQKHGIEMGFVSSEEYLFSANKVINNSKSLHKLEQEDGDDLYYLEASNEFVVVSTDGYIRTYFYPDDGIEYYNRQ